MKVLHDFFSFISSLELCSYVSATLELFKLVQVFFIECQIHAGDRLASQLPKVLSQVLEICDTGKHHC